jgi:hypothetical protein
MSQRQQDRTVLPDDVLWAEGGHASDIVLSTLADGQAALVPPAVRIHVERCTVCTVHLGHAALLSLHVGRELAARAEHERVFARRPLPRSAIALGLAVAVLGLVPSIFDPAGLTHFATRDVPISLRGLTTLARHVDASGSAVSLFLTYGAAILLVSMGFVVVRLLPKKEASR